MLLAAMDLLERGGVEAVTARGVVADAGTSTAAFYELFGDKGGLVRGVFHEGFRLLAEELRALPALDDPRGAVVASLETSRTFSMTRPSLSEVMYARPFVEFDPTDEETGAAQDIYRHFVSRVATLLDLPVRARATVDAAQALVALNRGLVVAEVAGTLGQSPATVRRRRAVAVHALLDGLLVPAIGLTNGGAA